MNEKTFWKLIENILNNKQIKIEPVSNRGNQWTMKTEKVLAKNVL